MDILMRPGVLEYRVIGGTLDLYFVAGPRAIDVHEQYSQIVGQTQPMPFWSFGFQLCRWGYSSVNETRAVVDAMRAANIPLEVSDLIILMIESAPANCLIPLRQCTTTSIT
jgi:alpha-glucosidase